MPTLGLTKTRGDHGREDGDTHNVNANNVNSAKVMDIFLGTIVTNNIMGTV